MSAQVSRRIADFLDVTKLKLSVSLAYVFCFLFFLKKKKLKKIKKKFVGLIVYPYLLLFIFPVTLSPTRYSHLLPEHGGDSNT